MNQKLKNVILREGFIVLALLGGGSLLVIIDCLKSRNTVINMGVASRYYFPTTLGGIGILIFFFYPLYLLFIPQIYYLENEMNKGNKE